MSWFTQMLGNAISFLYLEEYMSSVVHPLWLFMIPILLYSVWLLIYIITCAVSFLLYLYKKMSKFQDNDFYSKFWDKPRQIMAQYMDTSGRIWHGYEIIGMEHMPKGPGIIIFYHSIMLHSYSLLVTKLYKEKGILCHSVVDHFIYRLPDKLWGKIPSQLKKISVDFFHWNTRGASDQEMMSWLIQMLGKWISFPILEEYLSFVLHPWWLLKLLILLYSLSVFLYLVLCATSFLLYVYKKMNNHQETEVDSKFWKKPRKVVAQVTDTFGKIWHGYEVLGMEHFPKGPGLIIYYHAAIPIDYSLFLARIFKEKGRECYSLADHAMYAMPGLKMFCDVVGLKDFKKAECLEILKKGHLLAISPGGSREAIFSKDYTIMWGHRTGFAQLALEAKVPIIPMFTKNTREAYRSIGKTRLTRWLYEKTRLFYLPICGGFPVKLRTYIGEPIPYDPNITAAELAEKTKTALENLRNKHQKRPGSILRALLERFDKHYKAN